ARRRWRSPRRQSAATRRAGGVRSPKTNESPNARANGRASARASHRVILRSPKKGCPGGRCAAKAGATRLTNATRPPPVRAPRGHPPPRRGGDTRNTGAVEHDLFRKPVPTPHQVRGRLFRDHAVMRIVGGRLRGRALTAPKSQGIRPTADRLRESLFN